MKRGAALGVLFLVATAVYLYAFPSATLGYALAVLLHSGVGILVALGLFWGLVTGSNPQGVLGRWGWRVLAGGAALGLVLIYLGTARRFEAWLYAHIALCFAGVFLLAAAWRDERGSMRGRFLGRLAGGATLLLAAGGIAVGAWWLRNVAWRDAHRVTNPPIAPESMEQEGAGPHGRFYPSSAETTDGQYIPADYFLQSKACERCHADIYKQWEGSVHHFSSFNNQWYRKSIEYLQGIAGTKPSKWCAGCHDPALLFSGMMDTPIEQIVDKPEARAGLSCMMCHSIVKVKSTMGQGDFVLEYPSLHRLAASENPTVRFLHDFLVRLNPEPHRRVFLKPFMRDQVPEFCSTCHKVHLDAPLNHYRWIRGFNEYDSWQSSGVSGQGGRAFYYPATPLMCADCHMPLVPSKDEGNIDGYVHSHRFPGANTAVPFANEDTAQMEASRRFLQDQQLTVDIFALYPAGEKPKPTANSSYPTQELSTTFAVGEEAELKLPASQGGEARVLTAPLGRVSATVRRGDDVLVDVVVRTRKVGHFFPGGTVDAYDVWLELQATDELGQTIFWSGKVENQGKGPVEPGAHFYKSLQIDAHGNPINKRNAWASRAVVYVHLIPPGAADTVHFWMHVPDSTGERLTLHAKLNYRKFQWWNTQFAFAGRPDGAGSPGEVSVDHDDRHWSFDADLADVSSKKKAIPGLPILTVAEDVKTLGVLPRTAAAPGAQIAWVKEDWTRWNDYGIGLFLEGDLTGAEQAFREITLKDPDNADGWTNVGRVLVQEGDTPGAREALRKALELKPGLARASFFYARVLREEGNYDEAARTLQGVLAQFPRDRVVHNELGRVYFLERRYGDATREFEQTLTIDPEDLVANYNLMLCYTGLGNERRADEYKERYLRFKADEAAQALTGAYRQAHPEDNNERQAIHEHVSVPLGSALSISAQKPSRTGGAAKQNRVVGAGR